MSTEEFEAGIRESVPDYFNVVIYEHREPHDVFSASIGLKVQSRQAFGALQVAQMRDPKAAGKLLGDKLKYDMIQELRKVLKELEED